MRSMPIVSWLGVLAVLLMTTLPGCASFRVADTQPLISTQLEPPGAESISKGGYRLASLSAPNSLPDLLVLVAMSGGGKRSAAFSYGALKGMRETMIPTAQGPRELLKEVSGISGVSGGSFTAAYYGLYRDKMFGRYKKAFLYQDTDSYIYGIYLLPWNWTWMVDPNVGTNDFMERVYDRALFHGATFKDLQAKGRPIIGISATDLNYGTPFVFTQEFFDLICSNLDDFPVARAVAASNGFPGLFTPVTLTSRTADCGGRKPGWVRRVTPAERRDPMSRLGVQANMIDRYLDPQRTRYVHLADGGIADNLGLRVAGSMMQNLAQSPAALTRRGYDRIRRILVISVDGQGAQDPTVAQRKAMGGLFSLFGLVSGAQIDRYNFETLTTITSQLREAVQALRTARCAHSKVIDGTACDDVQGRLVHISLAGMKPGPERDTLLAIPTGLTLKPGDADLLVAAGEAAVRNSQALQAFLRGYPSQQVAGSSTLHMAARNE